MWAAANKRQGGGASLVFQCRGPGSIPGQGTRPHVPQLEIPHALKKFKEPMCCN